MEIDNVGHIARPSHRKKIFIRPLAQKQSYFLFWIYSGVFQQGLRILTGKKHHQIKLQHFQKVKILAFGLLVHQINSS